MAPNINQTTETDDIITDYSQLAYCISKQDNNFKKLTNVIVLYPSIDEKIFLRNLGEFIGINAQLDFEESAAYNRIKNIIVSKLNKDVNM